MSDSTYQFAGWNTLLYTWGPRILGAVVILVVAWIVGKLVKSLLAKAIDRVPAIAQHNQAAPNSSSTGSKLGDIAYWLILLFGIVAALTALQLGPIVAPISALLTNIFGYIPNIVGAALIFLIGYIVASLVKRVITTALQAAGIDRMMAKFGMSGVNGAAIASALGTLAFVLILIPVAIAALQTLHIAAISAPAVLVLTTILAAIPHVLAAAIVLALGALIGRWIAQLVERVLSATGFDRALGSLMGASSLRKATDSADPTGATATAAGSVTPSKVAANLVLFAIVAFSAIAAARLLEFAALAVIINQILSLAGHIVMGVVIIGAGVLLADVLSNLIRRSMGQEDRFVAPLVRWSVIALSVAMGLRFMGIADEIVILAFGLILGSAAVAVALAFGLGAREAAGRLASHWVEAAQQPRIAQKQPAKVEGPSEPKAFPDAAAERFQ